MNSKEYLSKIQNTSIAINTVKTIEKLYGDIKNDIVKKILSRMVEMNNTEFLDNGYRVLDYEEIIDADDDLHVDFSSKGLLPLFDCSDNDFIVYDVNNNEWLKFNIVDEVKFRENSELEELL